jgi:hypothetical protein
VAFYFSRYSISVKVFSIDVVDGLPHLLYNGGELGWRADHGKKSLEVVSCGHVIFTS